MVLFCAVGTYERLLLMRSSSNYAETVRGVTVARSRAPFDGQLFAACPSQIMEA